MLTPEDKAAWLKALRSGQYIQTRNTLRDAKGFCCLGVLGDLKFPNLSDTDDFRTVYNYAHEELTTAVTDHLVDMNDEYGKSFDEIADWIEENVP